MLRLFVLIIYPVNALLNLKPKYNSHDGIPAFFFQTFAASLVSLLFIIFNYSLQFASFVQDLRHADSANIASHYRPISYKSFLSKVLESLF